jgi:hypothetical protein
MPISAQLPLAVPIAAVFGRDVNTLRARRRPLKTGAFA